MAFEAPVFDAFIGDSHDWRQRYVIQAPDPTIADHLVTPTSGKVTITYRDAGVDYYWTGLGWTTTPTTLSTTIAAGVSVYSFTVPVSARGKTIQFDGYVERNGAKSPVHRAYVQVSMVDPHTLAF